MGGGKTTSWSHGKPRCLTWAEYDQWANYDVHEILEFASWCIPPQGSIFLSLTTQKASSFGARLDMLILKLKNHMLVRCATLQNVWFRYSTISGKCLLMIAWAVSLLPLLSGVFTEIRLHNSLSPGMLSTHFLLSFGVTFMQPWEELRNFILGFITRCSTKYCWRVYSISSFIIES